MSFKSGIFYSTYCSTVPHLLSNEIPDQTKIIYLNEIMDYDKNIQLNKKNIENHIFSLYNPAIANISKTARLSMNSKNPNTILCAHRQGTQVFHDYEYYEFIKSYRIKLAIQLYDPLLYKRDKHLQYLKKSLSLDCRVIPVVMVSDISFLDTVLELCDVSELDMIVFDNDLNSPIESYATTLIDVQSKGIVPYCIRVNNMNDIKYCKENGLKFDSHICQLLTLERKILIGDEVRYLSEIARKSGPMEDKCKCEGCCYSSYYVQHLVRNKELLAEVCIMHHNLMKLMQ
eukprot:NODE_535_length_7046_cov_0.230747.p3 type:complete len:287 gc:universal NODE_535_length_7046_cov_0.230747:174-1034(+)